MPYNSVSELPDHVKKLPEKKQRQWMHVWNSAFQRAKAAGKSAEDAEASAFRQANSIIHKMRWLSKFISDWVELTFPVGEVERAEQAGATQKATVVKHTPKVAYEHLGSAALRHEVVLKSIDDEEQIVYGIVMEPTADGVLAEVTGAEGVYKGKLHKLDAHGEFTDEGEIRKTMIAFMEEFSKGMPSGAHNIQHSAELIPRTAIVESYQAPMDFYLGGEGEEHFVRKGSWVMGTKVYDPEVWAAIKSGDITGYSIEGVGYKVPVAIAE